MSPMRKLKTDCVENMVKMYPSTNTHFPTSCLNPPVSLATHNTATVILLPQPLPIYNATGWTAQGSNPGASEIFLTRPGSLSRR